MLRVFCLQFAKTDICLFKHYTKKKASEQGFVWESGENFFGGAPVNILLSQCRFTEFLICIFIKKYVKLY